MVFSVVLPVKALVLYILISGFSCLDPGFLPERKHGKRIALTEMGFPGRAFTKGTNKPFLSFIKRLDKKLCCNK